MCLHYRACNLGPLTVFFVEKFIIQCPVLEGPL